MHNVVHENITLAKNYTPAAWADQGI